jgi:hypothetical protein
MRIIRTPVAGQTTARAVPALPDGLNPGSLMVTVVAVPVVMTRAQTPSEPKLESAMVSDADGVRRRRGGAGRDDRLRSLERHAAHPLRRSG